MDKRIIIEFTDGRSFENLVNQITGLPEDEVLAAIERGINLMKERGFYLTGTRTFQEWTPMGWIRMAEAELHTVPASITAGFRTHAAYLR